MRIVAYKASEKNGKVLLEESSGEFVLSNNPEELFAFLLEEYDDTIKVCWELDTTVALFLRLLGTRVCRELQEKKKSVTPPFSIFYVPDKVFSVSHIPTKHKANLYELQQYFPDLSEMDNVEEVQMLGVMLMEELERMGLEPTKLTSPVAIYEECILRKMDLPQVKDIPVEAAEMAYHCSGKLWIESHQLGRFESVFDYDLISAFPSIAKELHDTRLCNWVHSAEYQPDAAYGYIRGKVEIFEWVMVSPIMQAVDGGLVSPVGVWETWLTKGEIDFIERYKIGKVKVGDGWWAIPKEKGVFSKPLYAPIGKLLSYKEKTALQALLAKRMSTGIYGKFGEERTEEFGDYFNPVWFAEISTQTRLRVADFLYAYGVGPGDSEKYRSLVHIGVDGVMLEQLLPGAASGKWRLAYKGEALVVSSGLVYTKETRPKGLRLSDIKEMIAEHPRRGYYSKGIVRRVTLGDALAKQDVGNIGKEVELVSSINLLDQEHDRVFKKVPKSGEQLMENRYQSRPRRAV